MKKRKTLAMGLAVAMAVSCLAGCGGDDKKASSDPADQHNWPG